MCTPTFHPHTPRPSRSQYIVSAGQLGLVVGFAGGLFADACGPRNTAVVGGIMIALGYILEWAAITQWLPRPGGITAAATLSALSLVAIAGGILADVASISSNVRHFPRHRGAVTGALKSLLGLSASLVAQVYTAFYAPHGGIDFLLFLGLAGGTVFILGGLWLNAPSGAGTAAAPDTPALRGGSTAPAQGGPGPAEDTQFDGVALKRITAAAGIVLAVSALVGGGSFLQHAWADAGTAHTHQGGSIALMAVAWGCIACMPFVTAFPPCTALRAGAQDTLALQCAALFTGCPRKAGTPAPCCCSRQHVSKSGTDHDPHTPDLKRGLLEEGGGLAMAPAAGSANRTVSEGQGEGEDDDVQHMHFSQAVCTLDLWLLLVGLSAGIGCGFLVVNNLGQMSAALTSRHGAASILVSLLSVMNCLGRVSFAYGSDVARHYLLREGFMVISLLLMAGAFLVMYAGTFSALIAGCMMAGLAFGSFWSLMPSLVSDLFGRRFVAGIYGFTGAVPAVVGFLLSAEMSTAIYDAHTPPGSDTCKGKDCYGLTFLICAGVCGVGVLAILWLWARVRAGVAPNAAHRDAFKGTSKAAP